MKNCLCKITAFLLALIILTSCTSNTNSSSVNKTESSTTADTTVTTSDTQATTTTTAETSATTTTATTAATTAAPTKPATTKPTTAATTPPPAKVVIPTVKVPTSPGTEVYTGGGAVIDVSNKSQGYFSAKYTGSNPTIKVRVLQGGAEKFNCTLRTDNQPEFFPFTLGNGTYQIQVLERLPSAKYGLLVQQDVSVSLSSSLSPFLYPNQKVNFSQGSACVKKSAEVCAGKTSDIDKIGAIFKFVTSNVTYDTAEANAIGSGAITDYTPFPDEVLSTRKGICYDYASLFAAMTRAQGIPTKLVMGYVPVNGSTYHAWNEVYTNETGWIVVEFKAVPGFNTLDPTFYAGGNKASVASRFTDKNYYKVSKLF